MEILFNCGNGYSSKMIIINLGDFIIKIFIGERDTLRGYTIENWGYLFVYILCVDVRMSFCTLTLTYFCVRSAFNPVPNFTKQNPPV